MFPLAEMNPALVAPLTTNEFVQRILVPEVALHLIMEDKRLTGGDGMKSALAILRDSSAYGVAMFPEDGGEWDMGRKKQQEDKIGVGDMIVMERARKRRIELADEDKHEEAQIRESEAAVRKSREKEERTKAKRKEEEEEMALASSDTNNTTGSRPRPRPRPRPTMKDSSSSAIGAPLSSLANIEATTMRARSRSRSVRNALATDVSSDTDDFYVSDRHRASSMERRRSPSASETRNEQREEGMRSQATRSRMASLTLGSDSESSTRAEVGKGKRASSRARSVAMDAPTKRSSSVIELDSDDDEVEIVGSSSKTPVVTRRPAKAYSSLVESDEEDQATPKPAVQLSSLAPLERSRLKKKMEEQAAARNLAARCDICLPVRAFV